MAITDVKIVDTSLSTDAAWARETTMQRLLEQARDQTSALNVLANVAPKAKREAAEAARSLKDLAKGTDEYLDTLESVVQSERKRERERSLEQELLNIKNRKYRDSVDDLRDTIGLTNHSFKTMISSTNPLQSLPSMIENAAMGIGKSLGKMGPLFALAGAAAAHITDKFMQGAESYRGMMQSGVMFNGSVAQMITSVRSAGVTIEDASQVIGEFSQAIQAAGEQRFFQSIENSAALFARLGMTQTEGMRTFAELDEMRRLSGVAYMQSEHDRTRTNEELVTLMQSQATLTGISVKRQRDEARRVAQSEKVRFLQAGMSRDQREAQEQAIIRMTSMGMNQELIDAVLIEGMTGVASRQTGLARNTMGPEIENIITAIRSSRYEDIGTLQQRESIGRATTRFAQEQRGVPFATSEAGRIMTTQVVGGMEANVPTYQAGPGREAALAERRERSQRILRGENVLDQATRGYFTTVNQTAVAMGRVEGMVMRLANNVLGPLMESLGNFTTAVNNAVGALGGRTGQGLGGAMVDLMSNPLMLMGTALGGGLLASRFMGGAAGAGAGSLLSRFRAPATPTNADMFGPPKPDALLTRRERLMGSLSRIQPSLGGGIAGMGMVAAGGLMGEQSMLGRILSSAGTGASIGALAGPKGALIGGLAGAAYGVFSGGGESPSTPAGTPAPSPAGPAAPQMSSLMEKYWGDRSTMITLLNEIKNLNEKIAGNTLRTANALE